MSTEFDADVIVVGAGTCGSLLAHRLATAGKQVILLEAGPDLARWKNVEHFRNNPSKASPNSPYPDTAYAPKSDTPGYMKDIGPTKNNPSYARLVGGTTWHWAGAAYRFLPNDFKMHSLYGVGEDWPFGYDELEPYYGQAEREMGVSGPDDADQSGAGLGKTFPPRSTPYPMPPQPLPAMHQRVGEVLSAGGFQVINEPTARNSQPYDGRPACQGNNSCTPVCPIGALYNGSVHAYKTRDAGGKLIAQAVVYKIEKGEGGRINAVIYKSPDGKDHRLTARIFVLAAYSVETPRLLLMNDIANSSDMVGRNFSCQPESHQSYLGNQALWPGRGPVHPQSFYTGRDGDFRRTRSGTKNVIGNNNPNAAITAKLLAQGIIGPKLDEMIRDQASRYFEISTQHEFLHNPKNRVTLSTTRKDGLGLPAPDITFSTDDPYFQAGVAFTKQVYQRVATLFGATDYEPFHWVYPHTQGTTVMGSDPKTSVVDAHGKTHDHDNLYIVGPNVMTTTGTVNPTLTAAALSLRTADAVLHAL